jgi:hypothetical protein
MNPVKYTENRYNDYLKKCISNIHSHSENHFNNDTSELSQREYLQSIHSEVKTLLNSLESLFSYHKYELINNTEFNINDVLTPKCYQKNDDVRCNINSNPFDDTETIFSTNRNIVDFMSSVISNNTNSDSADEEESQHNSDEENDMSDIESENNDYEMSQELTNSSICHRPLINFNRDSNIDYSGNEMSGNEMSDNEHNDEESNNDTDVESYNTSFFSNSNRNTNENIFTEEYKSEDELQSKLQGESQNESQDKLQSKLQGESQNESQNEPSNILQSLSINSLSLEPKKATNVLYNGLCMARVKKTQKFATDDTPDYYYKDEHGFIYGRQCNKPRLEGELLCSKHNSKKNEEKFSYIFEEPKSKKNHENPEETFDNDEPTITLNKIVYKDTNYYINMKNGDIYDFDSRIKIGCKINNDIIFDDNEE